MRKETEMQDHVKKNSQELQLLQRNIDNLHQEKMSVEQIKTRLDAMIETLKKEVDTSKSESNNLRQKLEASQEGNQFSQSEVNKFKDSVNNLEKTNAKQLSELKESQETIRKLQEELLALEMRRPIEINNNKPFHDIDLYNSLAHVKAIFPELIYRRPDDANACVQDIMNLFLKESHYYIALNNFGENSTVICIDKGGFYEILTEGRDRYFLNPECFSVWEEKMKKKESFVGQMLYSSVERAEMNDPYRQPLGTTYYLATVGTIESDQ